MNHRRSALLGIAAGSAILTMGATHPLLLNTTPSEPEGLYLTVARNPAELPIGAYVEACPPSSRVIRLAMKRHYLGVGSCPDGAVPLLKQIGAVAGDQVAVSAAGVRVDGHLLPNSAPLPADQKGRALPHYPFGVYHVPEGQVWLLSEWSPSSFDGRYFGPVPARAIGRIVRPLWTER